MRDMVIFPVSHNVREGVFSAGTHEAYALVPATYGSDHLGPLPMHPDEVHEFAADGWTVHWVTAVGG